ncbi:flagellar hook-length control protein FliK [uncultured Tateyamaria sp.]|uniref:flagellar hook-length control protein FliK n=1 Tax=uncultured Tateyamaria sp. TaxID=455651 RepID=UPI00260FF7CD|nr:flagellar hook-length control protein FliK [uncultured Tateyamaria sp.]
MQLNQLFSQSNYTNGLAGSSRRHDPPTSSGFEDVINAGASAGAAKSSPMRQQDDGIDAGADDALAEPLEDGEARVQDNPTTPSQAKDASSQTARPDGTNSKSNSTDASNQSTDLEHASQISPPDADDAVIAPARQATKESPITAMVQGMSQSRDASKTQAGSARAASNSHSLPPSGPATLSVKKGVTGQPETVKASAQKSLSGTAQSVHGNPGSTVVLPATGQVAKSKTSAPTMTPGEQAAAIKPTTTENAVALSATGSTPAARNAASDMVAQIKTDQSASDRKMTFGQTEATVSTVKSPVDRTQTADAVLTKGRAADVQTGPRTVPVTQTTSFLQMPLAQRSGATDPTIVSDELVWDMRPTSAHQTTANPASVQKPELPANIPPAIADAFKRAPDKPIEIALNPIELGRVRMVMATNETGMIVTVTAERGDTLDLMRRYIDDLGKSLSNLGFEDVSFTFEQGQDRTDQKELDEGDTTVLGTGEREDTPLQNKAPGHMVSALPLATTGIDMRF